MGPGGGCPPPLRMASWSGGSVIWRCPRGPAAGRARGRRHRGHQRAGLVSRLAAGVPGAAPRGHGAGFSRCSRFGLRAGVRGCMLQHECPLARAARCRGGWVHDRDDREGLPAVLLCLDAGAVAADLAAGTLACPSCPAGAGPVGVRPGTAGPAARRAHHAAAAPAGALPLLPPHPDLAAGLVRAAPRGRHRGHRRCGGPGNGRGRSPAHRRGARRPGRHRARLAAPPARPRGAAPPARHRRAELAGLLPARVRRGSPPGRRWATR